MNEIWQSLFRLDYMPHGYCYLWKPEILWLNVVSDIFIAFAYFTIPFALYYFVKKRSDIEFKGIFILFSLFIAACGITHLLSVYVIWTGAYGIHGMTKFATAIISTITAYRLFVSIPLALQIPTNKQVRAALEEANEEKIERLRLEHQREQDEILRESTDSAHVGILVVNQHGAIVVANKATCQIFNYQHAELEGKHINVLIAKNLHVMHNELIRNFMSQSEVEYTMAPERLVHGVDKYGRKIPLEVKLTHRTYQGNSVVFASLQDITERLKTEKAKQKSELVTQTIIQSLPMGLHMFELIDGDLILVNANPASRGLLNTSVKDIGKSIDAVFPAPATPQDKQAYLAIAEHGTQILNHRVSHKGRNGQHDIMINAFQSHNGRVIILFQDVTEQQRAERALRKQDIMVRRAINASIAGVFIYNTVQRRNRYINDRYFDITGYSLNDLSRIAQQGLISLIHPEDRYSVLRALRKLLKTKRGEQIITLQFRLKHTQQEWVWLMTQIVVFERDALGNVLEFMGSFFDISPLKNLQHNLLELKEKAEAANAAKSDFLANMSHEIRTPMNASLALTEMVLSMDLGAKQRDYLEKVYASSRLLLQLLNDILDYSKLEAGKLNIVAEPFDLYATVSTSMRLFSVTANQKLLNFSCHITSSVPRYLIGDNIRLGQILNNLLGNAIKFTQYGHVRVNVSALSHANQNCVLLFEVIDSGIGIAANKLDELFNSFTQADSSIARQYGGSGLGLTICKQLTELMDGEISAKSTDNTGSVFAVQLPFAVNDHALATVTLPTKLDVVELVSKDDYTKRSLTDYFYSVKTRVVLTEQIKPHSYEQNLVMLVDSSSLTDAEKVSIVDDLANSMHSIHWRGLIIIASENDQLLSAHVPKLPCPVTTLVKPFVPSDIELALMQVCDPHAINKGKSEHIIPAFEHCRVLVVEDNLTNQFVAQELLTKVGINVVIANNGEEAVRIFENDQFDAIFMDLQMPVMDGYQASRHIRNNPKGTDIPLIAMSAAVMQDDISRVKEAGMDAHIAKPVEQQVLYSMLTDILAHKLVAQQADSSPSYPVIEQGDSGIPPLWRSVLHGFSLDQSLARIGFNKTTYIKLIRSFHHEYQCYNTQSFPSDTATLSRVIHSLKGLSATIGATHLNALTEHADDVLKEGGSPDNIAEILSELRVVLGKLRLLFEQLQEDIPNITASNNSGTLDSILEALENRRFLNDEELAAAQQTLGQYLDAEKVQQCITAMRQFKYELALTILTSK